ncbi:hypothetical protein BC939DRAFT_464696 [Gamsiella multidivaricata]|uniref:uncharacterized protein n=1 Tax=Gamsiella multidivaricata TaxID=101098 RepID=UPI00221F7DD1|nr:uncharacterized protein BC939DRAFT_464696 [Gamsiella multidivaricata]KAI7817881.1 hypothetical protein BC939DRAFT_464696 [Gamsiella multidivaricata]
MQPGQDYFQYRIVPQYDPSTPPLDPGPLQVTNNTGFSQSFSSYQQAMDIEAHYELPQCVREGLSIRSLSPAPSSPSESIIDHEGSTNRDQNYRPDSSHEEYRSETCQLAEKKATGGKPSIIMGYRPGCERCRRREKGHFAHFG